jgi:hypothetical protein
MYYSNLFACLFAYTAGGHVRQSLIGSQERFNQLVFHQGETMRFAQRNALYALKQMFGCQNFVGVLRCKMA